MDMHTLSRHMEDRHLRNSLALALSLAFADKVEWMVITSTQNIPVQFQPWYLTICRFTTFSPPHFSVIFWTLLDPMVYELRFLYHRRGYNYVFFCFFSPSSPPLFPLPIACPKHCSSQTLQFRSVSVLQCML